MKLVGWFLGEKAMPVITGDAIKYNYIKPSLASQKRDIGKQSRPRADAAKHGVWSGTTQKFMLVNSESPAQVSVASDLGSALFVCLCAKKGHQTNMS